MEASHILIAGVGGIGCSWAKGAHARCEDFADICLVDADDASFENNASAHLLRLGHALDSVGCAARPPLAERLVVGLGRFRINRLAKKSNFVFLCFL